MLMQLSSLDQQLLIFLPSFFFQPSRLDLTVDPLC